MKVDIVFIRKINRKNWTAGNFPCILISKIFQQAFVRLSQTLFRSISTNSLTILMVLTAMESPWKDLLIDASYVLRQSILTKISDRLTGNYYSTIY